MMKNFMKRRCARIIAAAALSVACFSGAACAENFVEADRTDRNIAYIDVDSIKDNGSYITAVSKVVIRTPEERARFKEKSGLDAHYFLLTFAYNKEAPEDQLLNAEVHYGYEVTGTDKKEFSADAWRRVPPGSVGETIYQKVTDAVKKGS